MSLSRRIEWRPRDLIRDSGCPVGYISGVEINPLGRPVATATRPWTEFNRDHATHAAAIEGGDPLSRPVAHGRLRLGDVDGPRGREGPGGAVGRRPRPQRRDRRGPARRVGLEGGLPRPELVA